MASPENVKATVSIHGLCRLFEEAMDSTRYYEGFHKGYDMGDYFDPSPLPRQVLNKLRFFGNSEGIPLSKQCIFM